LAYAFAEIIPSEPAQVMLRKGRIDQLSRAIALGAAFGDAVEIEVRRLQNAPQDSPYDADFN